MQFLRRHQKIGPQSKLCRLGNFPGKYTKSTDGNGKHFYFNKYSQQTENRNYKLILLIGKIIQIIKDF